MPNPSSDSARMRPVPVADPSTHVVQLTPPGRGAVAVVLVTGPEAVTLVDRIFVAANRRLVAEQARGRIVFGRWQGPPGRSGEELVICRRGDDCVEVHPHGGTAAVRAVIDQLVDAGCKRLDWKAWIPRTVSDPIRASARIALAHAPTQRTAFILFDQYQGALPRALEHLESIRQTAGATARYRAERDQILARAELGRHLIRPWRVVLAGRPNVGKSSLANAILGYPRALVASQPGTTRDVVTARTAIDGWPVMVADTAGFRASSEALEAAAIGRTTGQLADADLVLWIEEGGWNGADPWPGASVPGNRPIDTGFGQIPAALSVLRIVNKIDLLSPRERAELLAVADDRLLATSAKTGAGIERLLAAISRKLVPDPPPPGAAVPFTDEQTALLRDL